MTRRRSLLIAVAGVVIVGSGYAALSVLADDESDRQGEVAADQSPLDPTGVGLVPEGNEPALDEVRDRPTQVELPSSQILVTPDAGAEITNGVGSQVTACLSDQGFEAQVPPAGSPAFAPDARRFGITSLEDARSVGYGLPGIDGGGGEAARAYQDFVAALGDEGSTAYSECVAAVERSSGLTELQNLEREVVSIANEASMLANEDRRSLAAMESWSQCMASRGHDYQTVFDATGDPRWAGRLDRGGPPTQEELDVAVADVECKNETNLVGILEAVDSAYQRDAFADHQDLVNRYAQQLASVLAQVGG